MYRRELKNSLAVAQQGKCEGLTAIPNCLVVGSARVYAFGLSANKAESQGDFAELQGCDGVAGAVCWVRKLECFSFSFAGGREVKTCGQRFGHQPSQHVTALIIRAARNGI